MPCPLKEHSMHFNMSNLCFLVWIWIWVAIAHVRSRIARHCEWLQRSAYGRNICKTKCKICTARVSPSEKELAVDRSHTMSKVRLYFGMGQEIIFLMPLMKCTFSLRVYSDANSLVGSFTHHTHNWPRMPLAEMGPSKARSFECQRMNIASSLSGQAPSPCK